MTTARAPTTDSSRSIDLRSVLAFLRRGAPLAILVAVVAGGTAYLLTSRADPVYRASIVLVASQPGSAYGALDVVTPPQLDPAVYRSALFEGNVVSDALLRLRGQQLSETELEAFLQRVRVNIEARPISSVIRIEVEDNDPVFSAEVANAIADELIVWDRERARRTLSRSVSGIERIIAEIDAELAAGDITAARRATLEQLRAQRLQELEVARSVSTGALVVGLLEPLRFATPPERAVGPRVVFTSFVAVLLGLMLGYGLYALRGALDTRIGSRSSITASTGLPVLAEFARRRGRERRLSGETASFLRTNVALATRGASPRILVVTSGYDNDEKDGVAVALAESFARSGSQTLLVDADLRNPATTAWLDLVPSQAAPFEVHLANPDRRYLPVTVAIGSRRSFDFVPSFTSARFPVDLLNQGLPEQLDVWKQAYDVIIFDATPVVPFADVLALAPLSTGVVLCANARSTTQDQMQEALGLLGRAGTAVLGLVLTNAALSRARRKAVADGVAVFDRQQAVDPYKTMVPTTRQAVDRTST